MTIEMVKHDVLVSAIAYAVSLLALLLWPNRQATDQNVVYFVGFAILIVVRAAVDWVFFKWRPSRPNRPKFDLLAFVTQTLPRTPTRRRRYAIPYFLGFMSAWTLAFSLRSPAQPDLGLTAFAVSVALLLGGLAASNAWWALASRSGSSDTAPR